MPAICLASMLVAACSCRAQTNEVPLRLHPEKAIRLASNLSLGMDEKEATALLESGGLKAGGRMGCSHCWTWVYGLADGSSLALEIAPNRARADGAWVNGLVRAAHIQRGGSNFAIQLQPGPQPQQAPLAPKDKDWQPLVIVAIPFCAVCAVAVVVMTRKAWVA